MATFAGTRTEGGLEHSQSITDTVGLTECQGGGRARHMGPCYTLKAFKCGSLIVPSLAYVFLSYP